MNLVTCWVWQVGKLLGRAIVPVLEISCLLMEWRSHQAHPEPLTTTDFQAARGEDHGRRALRWLFNKRPSLKPP